MKEVLQILSLIASPWVNILIRSLYPVTVQRCAKYYCFSANESDSVQEI